jgi:UDP-N-acetylglucosamine--N-acetylmuramyl-(pentapeptide) pyrophosphoryl-undecaprenol N-acetylglucosamine transferase
VRVIFAGGGTGGHLFPGLAIAEELEKQEPGSEILFVVNDGNAQSVSIRKYGFRCTAIRAGRLAGRSFRQLVPAVFLSFAGFMQSLLIIRNFKPDIVVGLGSYVSGPLVLAAVLLRKRTILQEQNYIPGLTTRLLSRFVDEVEVTFTGTEALLSGCREIRLTRGCRGCVTGNPVRGRILEADRTASAGKLGLSAGKLNLVVFGGSRGARRINEAVSEILKGFKESSPEAGLLKSWRVVHITGRDDYARILETYESKGIPAYVSPFIENMEDVYGAADLVVCRAGGSTIAELTARGVPAIYIPYPWASANHQEHNARWVCERGAGELVLDSELAGQRLCDCMRRLMCDEEKRRELGVSSRKLGKPDAAKLIVERMRILNNA